jgi:prepilin signal peptidase PulO-like enzyme (type II secretory pathway)
VRLRRLRLGESLALLGALAIVLALVLPSYENGQGKLSAWATFGPAVVLLMLGALGGLLLALATVTERSTALPVAGAVWGTLLGFFALIAALVRVLERPQGASMLCAGAWVALGGALAILIGSWQSMRDERGELYPPDHTVPRPPPDVQPAPRG